MCESRNVMRPARVCVTTPSSFCNFGANVNISLIVSFTTNCCVQWVVSFGSEKGPCFVIVPPAALIGRLEGGVSFFSYR